MQRAGLRARGRCRRRYTTQSTHSYPIAPNRLAQQFAVPAPNRVWVTDITSVATDEGWVYVALVMDLFSRKWVGWALEPFVDCRLTIAALRIALGRRKPDASLMHHSDRGVHYAAADYRAVLAERSITLSMSRKAIAMIMPPMESANGTIKTERVYAQRYTTRADAKTEIIEYISYYNTERRHSALGHRSPAEYERQWWSQQRPAGAPRTAPKREMSRYGSEGDRPL